MSMSADRTSADGVVPAPASAPYQLSDAQQAALASMVRTLGMRPRRMPFADRAEFQRYWDRLTAACAQRRVESPAERRTREEAKAARMASYYANEEHLLAYAKRYCQRYQPSVAKLRAQLQRKAGTSVAPIDAVLARLESMLDDDRRARELADQLRAQGRNARAIASKLRQRQFTPETITRCLNASADDTGSLWDTEALTRKVRQLLRKGTASATIRRTLVECPADGPLVDAALAALMGDTGDDPAIITAIARLRRRNLDDPTIIRRLQAKGFRYAAIVQVLRAP